MENKTQKLDAAVFRVMEKVDYLKKDGKNAQQGYAFASAESIIGEVRAAALSEKLRISISYSSAVDLETAATKNGGNMFRVRVASNIILRFEDECELHTFYGEGADSGDKALSKAKTMCLKQALRQLFLIETGEHDADRETQPETVKSKVDAATLASLPDDIKDTMRSRKMSRAQVEAMYLANNGDPEGIRAALAEVKK